MAKIRKDKHILLVVDAFSSVASGARVAQHIVRLLLGSGHAITVLEPGSGDMLPEDLRLASDLEVIPWHRHRLPSLFHVVRDEDTRHFSRVLDEIRPDVVHLCSFNYGKSRFLVPEAHKRGIRVVAQYFRHAYCGREEYDVLDGGPCGRCNGGRTWNALKYGCGSPSKRPVQVLSRYLIWKLANPLIDVALSTCTHMDDALVRAGIPSERIVRCPLPYDANQLEGIQTIDGDHVFFSGAFLEAKGAHLLEPVVEAVSDAHFVLLFLTPSSDRQEYEDFQQRLTHRYGNRVYVDDKMRWDTGGSEFARKCRGALQPSVWPSSTEYTLLEMLGLGKPIVAFNVGMHRDYLVHQKNALVYEIGDHKGFIDGVAQINRDPALRRSLAKGARKLFDLLTDDDVIHEALLRAYDF
jgi:glycosyltransferase involved in cell wall biosynthesis